MRLWNKKAPILAKKSASFLFSMGGLRGGLANASYDTLANEGYAACAVAYACINKIANSIASVDLEVYGKGKDGKRVKIDKHPLADLLNSPNPAQSGDEFFRHLSAFYLLSGNAYVLGATIDPLLPKNKPPTELLLLNPGKVTITKGESLFPDSYEYRNSGSKKYVVNQLTGRSAVMHIKTFNPVDPWYGMSPLIAAAFGVDIYNGSQKWNKRLLDNDARPSGALTVKETDGKPATLSEEQYTRLQEMIESNFSGANNSGKPLLLEGGLEWTQLGMSSKDMDFSESKNSAARDIALAYGVPPQLLGIKGDLTFANYAEARLAFWTDTVLPLTALILEALNRWLVPLYGDNLEIWYNEDEIPALETLRTEKADRIERSTTMTINEKRRAMGLEDVAGGDVLLVDGSKIPLELLGDMNLPEVGSPADVAGGGQ